MPDPVRPIQPASAPRSGCCSAPAGNCAASPASPQASRRGDPTSPRVAEGESPRRPHPTPRPWRPEGSPDPTQPFPRPEPYDPNLLGPQPKGTVPLIFEPSDEDRASLFRLISDPDFSLRQVAGFHNTSLPALSAWMARPDIAAELDAFEASLARKARLSAAHSLPSAVRALTHIADAYTHAERHVPEAPNTEARVQRSRQAETARRASWLLYRIVRYYAAPPLPPSPRSPARSSEGSSSPTSSLRDSVTPSLPQPRPSLPPLNEVADTLRDILAQAKITNPLDDPAPGGSPRRPPPAVSPPPSAPPAQSPPPHSRPSDLTPSLPLPSSSSSPSSSLPPRAVSPRARSSSCSSCSSSSSSFRDSHPHPRTADVPPSPPPRSPSRSTTIPVPLTISASGRAHTNGTHASPADTS